MGVTLAISSMKGGTGKTTTTINLGAALAARGRSVLLVDLDPQGHIAEGFGIPALSIEHELSDVLAGDSKLHDITHIIRPNLSIAPANVRLAHLELSLITQLRREDKLKHAIAPLKSNYDYIVIDCPPSLGILTVNAFSAANQVIIPMAAEFYALIGVALVLDAIQQMRQQLNPSLSVRGILPTRMDRTRHAREVVEKVAEELPDMCLFSPIPESVAARNASAAGKPLIEFDPASPASRAYLCLAEEVDCYVNT
jgi:chromosome partitioning protein